MQAERLVQLAGGGHSREAPVRDVLRPVTKYKLGARRESGDVRQLLATVVLPHLCQDSHEAAGVDNRCGEGRIEKPWACLCPTHLFPESAVYRIISSFLSQLASNLKDWVGMKPECIQGVIHLPLPKSEGQLHLTEHAYEEGLRPLHQLVSTAHG